MAKRRLGHWINDGFLPFTENTESTPRLLTFAAIAGVGALLERRVIIDSGRKPITAAVYVWIVGPAGKAKKTSSCDYMIELLEDIPGFNIYDGKITPEALMQLLGEKDTQKAIPYYGRTMQTTPMLLYAPELTDFMSEDSVKRGMADILLGLFDNKKRYLKKTKFCGNNEVPNPVVTMLGCTTPESLIRVIPTHLARAGLASRVIFVPEFTELRPDQFVPFPEITPAQKKLKQKLMLDLRSIYDMAGSMEITPEAKDYYAQWYRPFRIRGNKEDPRLVGFLQRMDGHVWKLALIDSVCHGDSFKIKVRNVEQAINWLQPLEADLTKIYKTGRNPLYPIAEDILKYTKQQGRVSTAQLLRYFNIEISNKELSVILHDLTKRGDLRTNDHDVYYPILRKPSSSKQKSEKPAAGENELDRLGMNGE